MHEFTLCKALIAQVTTIALAHRARGVKRVTVQIGPLAGVEPALLAQAYPFAREGTLAAEAELTIEPLPIWVQCRDCGAETEPAMISRLACTVCKSFNTRLLSGDAMLLKDVELNVR